MMPKKPKAYSKKWNIKSSGIDFKMRCIIQKWSNVMYCKEAKWKASKLCNHFCGRSYMFISIIEIDLLSYYQLCMTWLNWSLKLHTRLWTSYTWSTHTRHKTNVQLFHLCDCTCSNVMCILKCLSIKPTNIFKYFICFLKCFYAFVFWVFV